MKRGDGVKMKRSEARILIFLSVAADRHKYAKHIASKLGMDYGYCIQILNGLKFNKMIKPSAKRANKIFYSVTKHKHIEHAKMRLGK